MDRYLFPVAISLLSMLAAGALVAACKPYSQPEVGTPGTTAPPAASTTRKMVITPQFDSVLSFHEGRAAVRVGDDETGKWGYIDTHGTMVIGPQYDEASPFNEGLAVVRVGDDETGKWGYIDTQVRMVIGPQFDAAQEFSAGLAAVLIDLQPCKWGCISR